MLVTLILPGLALVSTALAMPAPQAEARSVVDNLPRGFKDQNLCVRDPAKFNYNDRLLKGQNIIGDGTLTYEKCANFCYDNGWQVAGLQYYNECYCGAKQDLNRAEVLPLSECYTPCAGNSAQQCGGDWALRILVTDKVNMPVPKVTSNVVPNFPEWQYQNQCNVDNRNARALPFQKNMDPSQSSWSTCVGICEAENVGYNLAGIEYGNECFCGYAGDFNAKSPKGSTDCQTPCTGANGAGQICGGPDALSIIYKGGIQSQAA